MGIFPFPPRPGRHGGISRGCGGCTQRHGAYRDAQSHICPQRSPGPPAAALGSAAVTPPHAGPLPLPPAAAAAARARGAVSAGPAGGRRGRAGLGGRSRPRFLLLPFHRGGFPAQCGCGAGVRGCSWARCPRGRILPRRIQWMRIYAGVTPMAAAQGRGGGTPRPSGAPGSHTPLSGAILALVNSTCGAELPVPCPGHPAHRGVSPAAGHGAERWAHGCNPTRCMFTALPWDPGTAAAPAPHPKLGTLHPRPVPASVRLSRGETGTLDGFSFV